MNGTCETGIEGRGAPRSRKAFGHPAPRGVHAKRAPSASDVPSLTRNKDLFVANGLMRSIVCEDMCCPFSAAPGTIDHCARHCDGPVRAELPRLYALSIHADTSKAASARYGRCENLARPAQARHWRQLRVLSPGLPSVSGICRTGQPDPLPETGRWTPRITARDPRGPRLNPEHLNR